MHQCFAALCKINKAKPGTSDGCTKNLFFFFFFIGTAQNSPPNTLWGYNLRDDRVSVACRKKVLLFFCLFVATSLVPSRGFSEYDVLILRFKGGAVSHRGAMAECCVKKEILPVFLFTFNSMHKDE